MASSAFELTAWKSPACLGAPQAARVDGEQEVGRAVRAFRLDPLDQGIALAFDAVDLDPGFLGEVRIERFVGLIVPGGVEVQLRRDGEARYEKCGDKDRKSSRPPSLGRHVARSFLLLEDV